MMSANSSLAKFIKEQKEYTYRRLPLAALSIIMYFLYDVFGTLMLISRERAYTYSETSFDLRGAAAVSGLMGLRGFHWFIGCVGAVLLAVQGFSYLYKIQTVDFYESRPEKRSTRFINIVVNGLFIYALPSFAGVLLSYLLAAINGCAPSWLLTEMMMAWGYGTVLFLAVYGISILSSVLTGTIVTAVAMNIFLLGIEALIRLTILGYRAAYYATFDMSKSDGLMSNIYTLPPFNYLKGIILSKIYAVYDYDFVATNDYILGLSRYCTKGTLVNLAIFVVTIILSFILFKKRKSEYAGKAVICRPLELVIKFVTATLVSLDAGLFIHVIFRSGDTNPVAPVILTILLVVILSSIIMEAIFAQNMRMAFNKPLHMPVIAVIAIAILFIYKSGITGYDTYLPKEAEVSSAWLLNNNYNADYYDEAEEYMPTSDYVENNMFLTDIKDMITLAQYAQAEAVTLKKNPPDNVNVWYSTIGWRMKDGRIVTRSVAIPETIDPALMDAIVGNEEFTNGVYHMNDIDWIEKLIEDPSSKRKFTFSTSTEHGLKETKKNVLKGFMEAYRNDVRDHYDFTMASNINPVGSVSIYDNRYFSISWPLYDSYEKTIEFLKANDLWDGGFILPSEVEKIEVSRDVYDDETGEYEDNLKEFTSESDIKKIMDSSLSTSYYSAWMRYGTLDDNNYYVAVYPKTKTPDDPNYEMTYSRSFYKDKVPSEMAP